MDYWFHPDTNTLEYGGWMTNAGRADIHGVDGPFAFDFCIDRAAVGPLRVSRLTGGASVDSCFPPPTFQWRTVDLSGSLTVASGEGGRSTEKDLPLVVVTDAGEKYGFSVALEWPCCWMIYCSQRVVANKGYDHILAHVWRTHLVLRRGMTIPLPRVVLSFFTGDAQRGGNALRRHIREHVTPRIQGWPTLPPVFYNTFGAYGGERFTAGQLKSVVDATAELGVEYFVLDAGWFEKGFRRGIGNWERPDRRKLPEGMAAFARYVESKGMQFGTWLEPEFAMEGSHWARIHPGWYCASRVRHIYPAYRRYRAQDLLLRIDDPKIRSQVLDFVEKFVRANRVAWLRWDFNNDPAPFWLENETPAMRGLLQLRYGQGLLELLDGLLARCPRLHLEACAGGGHRMDLGTLRRAHSCWMSDDCSPEAVRSRLKGMNCCLPGNYGNTNHTYPARWQMAGGLGLTFTEKSPLARGRPRTEARAEIAKYKLVRKHLLQDYYPLFNPVRAREWDGWQFHHVEAGQGFFMVFRCLDSRNAMTVHLPGLQKGLKYRLEDMDTGEKHIVLGGRDFRIRTRRKEGIAWYSYTAV